MRYLLTVLIAPAIMITFHSCVNGTNGKIRDQVLEKTTNDPKRIPGQYKIDFNPATTVLGEYREIFVQFTNGKIIQPDNAYDTSHPLQVSFTLSVSNKSSPLNKHFFFLSRSDAFVELSDGQSLAMTSGEGFASPDPATSNTICWSVMIPKNTVPVRLLLYHEKQQSSIKLSIVENETSP